jgi:hypothetical protein
MNVTMTMRDYSHDDAYPTFDCRLRAFTVTFLLVSTRVHPVCPLTFLRAVLCPIASMALYRRGGQAEVQTPSMGQLNFVCRAATPFGSESGTHHRQTSFPPQ